MFMVPIRSDMTIEEIVESYPQTIRILQDMGVQCIRCGEPVWGTLEQKVREKGLTNLPEILKRLNDAVDTSSTIKA